MTSHLEQYNSIWKRGKMEENYVHNDITFPD